jgi:hypothetical protein
MLKGIGTASRRQAHRLLQCPTVATRPLRVEELAEILALDFDKAKDGIPALSTDWRWDDQQQCVLSTCSSLIVIVDGIDDNFSSCRVVQFAHFSVKEFLTSDRVADLNANISHFHICLEPAHTAMAQAFLGILLQSDNNGDNNHEVRDGIAPPWQDTQLSTGWCMPNSRMCRYVYKLGCDSFLIQQNHIS